MCVFYSSMMYALLTVWQISDSTGPWAWFIYVCVCGVFLIGWVQSEGRRNPETQHAVGEEKSLRCLMNCPENCLSPTASPLTWIKRRSWDWLSVTCACVNCWTAVREDECVVRSCPLLCLMLTACVHLCLSLDVLEEETALDTQWNGSFLKALDGFLLVLSADGDIVYLSENVSKCLGLPQVILSTLQIQNV